MKVRIEIWNRNGLGIYVGRPSVFGNPFRIQEGRTREEALRLYREYLRAKLAEGGELAEAVGRLVEVAKKRGRLPLVCWCAPKPCHAEAIAEEVAARLKREGYRPEIWVWGREEAAPPSWGEEASPGTPRRRARGGANAQGAGEGGGKMIEFSDRFGPLSTPFVQDRLAKIQSLESVPEEVKEALEDLLNPEGTLEELLPIRLLAHHYQVEPGNEDLILVHEPGKASEKVWDAQEGPASTVWKWIMGLERAPL